MLRYFPNLLADELLYSALGRYTNQTGPGRFKPVVKEVFGTESIIATWEFTSHIENFVSNLVSGHCYSAEEIIFSNTMLPLYYPFLDKERQQYALEHMKGDNGKGIHMKLGVMASKVKGLSSLRYCPSCISEDIEQHRVAYWHRSHNVTGTSICHKHAVLLRDNCPVCGVVLAPKSKNELISLEGKCPNGHSLTLAVIDGQTYDKELGIAKAVNYLLNNDLKSYNASLVHKAYIGCLYEMNLVTPKGIISQAELIQQFRKYYGDNFLQRLGLDFPTKSGESWLSSLIRRPDKVCHPLEHILLINFLVGDMAIFLKQSQTEFQPFGKAPWLCLNLAAEHYGKSIVTKCSITRCSDTKKPVGTFECECGFIYSRRGPDTCEEDKFRVGRIKAFGSEWEDKLRRLALEKDKSLRAIARQMGADTNTIIKYLQKLGLTESGSSSDATDEGLSISMPQDELGILYADNIVSYTNENSGASRSNVRSAFRKEYIWLYRHNKKLLFSILPRPKASEKIETNLRVDWLRRDSEIFDMAKNEIQRILSADIPERITVGGIGRSLCLLPVIQHNIHKLPKTKQLLDEFTETTDDFQIRRAKLVIDQMILQDEPIKPWLVYRRAGLGISCSNEVKRKIFEGIPSLTTEIHYET
ncbi:MAG: TnsD family Tn7-like transposition protein [Desulfosporosinus sp.]|nr:TnsD family Tn7-like transposition protein [Desulfosporosinus sp.]